MISAGMCYSEYSGKHSLVYNSYTLSYSYFCVIESVLDNVGVGNVELWPDITTGLEQLLQVAACCHNISNHTPTLLPYRLVFD